MARVGGAEPVAVTCPQNNGFRLLPEDLVLLKPQAVPTIDARVVVFIVLSAFVLAMLTTIWPIRRALRAGATPLADGSRGTTRTRSIGRTVVISPVTSRPSSPATP